jgi:hypothetical protein
MSRLRLILEKQWLHALLLAILLVGLVAVSRADGFFDGELWGVSTECWFWLAVALPVIHQVYVWFCWRTELHASLLSRIFGDAGFKLYAVGFSILGIARTVVVFILAYANRDTLEVNTTVTRILAVILLIPAVYLFYSVKRFFGFRRAFGIDHFDASYRTRPFVRQGIFRFTSNGMYIFGFFILWVPGLWFASVAALVVALFNHLYIWVHYYSTELPDIRRIHGETATAAGGAGE